MNEQTFVLNKSQADNSSTATEELEQDAVDEQALDKALDSAISDLQKAKGKSGADNGYTAPEDDEDEDEPDDDEDDDYEPPPKKKMKKSKESDFDFEALSKSIEDSVVEKGGEGAEEVINAVPFMKALMDTIDEQLVCFGEALNHVVSKVDKLTKSLSKSQNLELAQATMLKSIRTDLRTIGNQPQARRSIINQADLVLLKKSGNDGTKPKNQSLTKSQALDKLTSLCKSGKISALDVTRAEGRINKGLPLSQELEDLIVKE